MSEQLYKLPMGTVEIEKCIPHRYPFLLIDRVDDYAAGEFILASRCISGGDPILQGHFPGNPVVPGVVIVEGMAQASAVLGKITRGEDCETCLLTEITKTRFRRQVVPGDKLDYYVKVTKMRSPFFWFEGQARVGDELAASASFSAKLI